MPKYDVYFRDSMANPFVEHPSRPVMRNLKADSVGHLRQLFKEAKKKHPRKFKNLTIAEVKKVSD